MMFYILFYIGLALILYNKNKRAQKVLIHWVDENDLKLVRARRRFFLRGPFPFQGLHVVYQVDVSDRESIEKEYWVMLGSVFTGLLSENIEVKTVE